MIGGGDLLFLLTTQNVTNIAVRTYLEDYRMRTRNFFASQISRGVSRTKIPEALNLTNA